MSFQKNSTNGFRKKEVEDDQTNCFYILFYFYSILFSPINEINVLHGIMAYTNR